MKNEKIKYKFWEFMEQQYDTLILFLLPLVGLYYSIQPLQKRLMPWGVIMRKGFNKFALAMLLSGAAGSAHWAISQRDKISYPDAVKRAYDIRGVAKPETRTYSIAGLLSVLAAGMCGALAIDKSKKKSRYIVSALRDYDESEWTKIFSRNVDSIVYKDQDMLWRAFGGDCYSYYDATCGIENHLRRAKSSLLDTDEFCAIIKRLDIEKVLNDLFNSVKSAKPYVHPRVQNAIINAYLSQNPEDIDKLIEARGVDGIPKRILDKYYRPVR